MTHLPAALQRSLAWQSTLLFDWDGMAQPYLPCMLQDFREYRLQRYYMDNICVE